jgi:hypothetical protein
MRRAVHRRWLVLPGLACLALAGFVRGTPPAAGSPLEALGRSLGGGRVLAVDVLALRCDALRRQGRLEELPQLYEAMVELDPGNAAATEALADAIAQQVLPGAPTAAQRGERWLEAWGLLERGLAAHPDSALLAWRASGMLLEVAERAPDLEAAVDARFGGPSRREALGLGYLLAAARAEESLPRSGRAHLTTLARESARLAARALARGQSDTEVLARLGAADELRRLHPRALSEIELLADPTPAAPEGRPLPLLLLLEQHALLLRAALEARAAGAPERLGAALEAFEARVGSTPASAVLAEWSRAR